MELCHNFTGVKHINSIKGGRNATADFGLIISKI